MKTKLSFFLLLCLVIVSRAKVPIRKSAEIFDLVKPRPVLTKPVRPMVMSPSAKLAKDPEQVTTYGKLPLSFEANQGQTDSQVQFFSRGSGYTLFLTKTEAVFQLRIGDRGLRKAPTQLPIDDFRLSPLESGLPRLRTRFTDSHSETSDSLLFQGGNTRGVSRSQFPVVRMKLIGANANPEIRGLDRLPGISNYFIGNDPKKWHTNIPNFSRVQYRDVYPGIDIVYYSNQRQLEYDLVVAPGADPHVMKLAYEGVEQMHVDAHGDLVLQVAGTEIRQHKPRVFQEGKKGRQEIAGNYVLKQNRQVAFHLSGYDLAKTLIIDPALSYSTYLGGSDWDAGQSIAVDGEGNAYIAGFTVSPDFPTANPLETPSRPGRAVFIAKLNGTGSELLYSTYLGGNSASGIAVDAAGNALVTGWTETPDFPTVNPLQPSLNGQSDAFVAKLNSTGSSLLYSTYLGGSMEDQGSGIAVDSSGNAYVTGWTRSANFPTSNPFQATFKGLTSAFVSKLNPAGSAFVYSTYLGGSNGEGGSAIAVDAAGNAYVTGSTLSNDFPTANPLQPNHGDYDDAFITKLNPSGSALVYSTYLGGNYTDRGNSIAVDASGNAYVTGSTQSDDFPTANAFQSIGGGLCYSFPCEHAFVTKLNATGSAFVYSTFLGRSNGSSLGERGTGVAVDSSENAYIVGTTGSSSFPIIDPFQQNYGGGDFDAFVAKLDPTGSALVYSSFLGGSNAEGDTSVGTGIGIALDSESNAYVTGQTNSGDFPASNALQPAFHGGFGDVFVAKITNTDAVSLSASSASFDGGGGTGIITVSAPAGYEWAATSNVNWITITSGGSGNGGGTVTYSVPGDNPGGGFRTGTLTVAGRVFAVTQGTNILFVPAVLSVAGLNNSFFTSEMTLTNRGAQKADLTLTYTAAPYYGGGSGFASNTLPPGQQRIIPAAISYLRSLGIPIPASGDRLGTLALRISGAPSSDVSVTVRTTTAVMEGRAGLAYSGLSTPMVLTGPSYLGGLRQNATDRSNLAIQNVGTEADGDITLSLTVISGDPLTPGQFTLFDTLAPGEFRQFTKILTYVGLPISNGYVRVAREKGTAPYYAYAVINDQANSDGSFIPPIPENYLIEHTQLTLPVVVENSLFSTELVITNWSLDQKTLRCSYVADAIQNSNSTANFVINVNPGEQLILPEFVQYLRNRGVTGLGPKGSDFAGSLFVWVDTGDLNGIFLGARTSAPGGGGRYGLFYVGIPEKAASASTAWLYGLQQNAETRTNLALVNTGEMDGNPDIFRIELFDGIAGAKVHTIDDITVKAKGWMQLGSILAQYAPGTTQGYSHVIRTAGSNSFIAYAVINDGGQPGERTGDGAFVSSLP